MSMPRVPALHSRADPKKLWVWRPSFPPISFLSSAMITLTSILPSSMAAEIPAGPAPMMNTSVSMTSGTYPVNGTESSGGSSGSPFNGITFIPSITGVIHDLTAMSSARTRHWAHCPLAQKIPWGAPSFSWVPKIRIPWAKRAEEIISPVRAVRVFPLNVKPISSPFIGVMMGWERMRLSAMMPTPGEGLEDKGVDVLHLKR